MGHVPQCPIASNDNARAGLRKTPVGSRTQPLIEDYRARSSHENGNLMSVYQKKPDSLLIQLPILLQFCTYFLNFPKQRGGGHIVTLVVTTICQAIAYIMLNALRTLHLIC